MALGATHVLMATLGQAFYVRTRRARGETFAFADGRYIGGAIHESARSGCIGLPQFLSGAYL